MALAHSPSIVRNGLVFYYDMLNTSKSWKGAPVTNLYGSIDNSNIRSPNTVHFWDGNNWSTTGSYTHPGVPGPVGTYLGKVYKFTSGALSSTWSGNSYGYMLKTMSTSNGQYNAMSCWAYVSEGCNIDYIPASIESASSSAAISGIPSYYDMSSKGTWQRIGLSCTASAGNMNFIPMYPQRYGVTDGSFTGFFMFAMPQVETNTYPSVGTETSRSDTQVVSDLTNNKTITASSLTYDVDNTFSFNGSSNYITAGALSGSFADFTINLWIYSNSVSNYKNPIDCNFNYYASSGNIGPRLEQNSSGNLVWILSGNTSSNSSADAINAISSGMSVNTWYNIGITRTSSAYVSTYVNGVVASSNVYNTNGFVNLFNNVVIGKGFHLDSASVRSFSGKIPSVAIYNRALSAAEVSQNFNAQRDTYGI